MNAVATSLTPLVADSITHLGAAARGAVAVTGSHGGIAAAAIAVSKGVRAAVFNDAGLGRDDAGVAGLPLLDDFAIAAAAVAHTSARIGEGAETMAHGVISHANETALVLGVRPGQPCRDAATALARNTATVADTPPPAPDTRRRLRAAPVAVWLMDSASEIRPADAGAIVITGSHGGLPGRDPAHAVKAPVLLAAFNDAGVGKDGAGIARLAALQARGIAGVAVAHTSARIGEAESTYRHGVISAVNAAAAVLGARIGQPLQSLVAALEKDPVAGGRP
ncbi:MAG: hypothetical protein SFV21_14820 [Rhodospirillaceae bacterium]|nr:hypothetical protein [Rhodospirillaceae bacterium]